MPDAAGYARTRRRVLGFVIFSTLCALGAGAYIALRPRLDPVSAGAKAGSATVGDGSGTTVDEVRRGPHIYFRSMRGDEFGRIVVASLDRPNDDRALTPLACDRIDFGQDGGICLVDNRVNFQPPGLATLVDRQFNVRHTLPLAGMPSRARLSPDESLAATTVFVTGESYASVNLSTRTHIVNVGTGQALPDLEQFVTRRGDRVIRAADFNFWGVTFTRDSRRFYATLATAGQTHLVEGDVEARTVRVLRENVECPSLSPDETRLVFKSRIGTSLQWRLHVLDLATAREWPVAVETRTIDDQVEWLDDEQVLYGVLEERGLPEEAMNVWVSPVAEGAQQSPRIFVRAAASPSVVRPALAGPTP